MTDEKDYVPKLKKDQKVVVYGLLLAVLSGLIMYLLLALPLHYLAGIKDVDAHNYGVFGGAAIFVVVFVYKAIKQEWISLLRGKDK